MRFANYGWAAFWRICALGLFVVAAIIYWGAWTPTVANGLLAAGLACLAGSWLFVPEATPRDRGVSREREVIHGDTTVSPRTRETERDRERVY